MLKGKKIVLGITGSIAAYKSCLIIRRLIKRGAEVQVVITPAGKEFITPITLSALTSKPVISDFFSQRDGTWHSHVALGLWADAMLIAPATASTIGKMAHGVADNMLITTYMSMKAPVFVAPAMDLDMYAHPATQANLDTLRRYGNHIIEPGSGFLASHLEGKGRMQEPEVIVQELEDFFEESKESKEFKEFKEFKDIKDLKDFKDFKDIKLFKGSNALEGKRVLITAGPTYEKIDPVRFIGNYSSGKMGFALAEECARRGADVELVAGPVTLTTSHPRIRRTNVESAAEMMQACQSLWPTCQAGILCAAVADYTPAAVADRKIKREKQGAMTLELMPTQDIAARLGVSKQPGQVLVGFALETDEEQTNAQDKLRRKHFDFIVLNSLRDAGAGFRTDTNKITIIDEHCATPFPLKSKQEVAADIVDQLAERLAESTVPPLA